MELTSIFLGLLGLGSVLIFVGFFVGKEADKEWRDQAHYYPVSLVKFIVMSYVTVGFYTFFWFYKNWWRVKVRDDSKAWPFWRAFFSGIWFLPLYYDVHKKSMPKLSMALGWLLAVVYFFGSGAQVRYDLRADYPLPVFGGALLEFIPLVVLLPLVWAIKQANEPEGVAYKKNSRFGPLAIAAIIIGGPIALHNTAALLNVIPIEKIYTSEYLWQKDKDYIADIGFIEDGEELVKFYSGAFLSIKESGNLVTTQKVLSYQEGADGTPEVFFVTFSNLAEIEVEYGTNSLDDTVVTLWDDYGEGFYFFLPGKRKTAEKFVSEIETRSGIKAKEVDDLLSQYQ